MAAEINEKLLSISAGVWSIPLWRSKYNVSLLLIVAGSSWAVFSIAGIDANGKSPSKAELHQLYLSEKYVWKWKQFMSRRGKRTCPLDLKLGHNNWLRQVNVCESSSVMHWLVSSIGQSWPSENIGSLPYFVYFAQDMNGDMWGDSEWVRFAALFHRNAVHER